MMGEKHQITPLFYMVKLDDLVPKDHILVAIKTQISFEFIREIVASYYPKKGQPSIDPVVVFKMMLIGYMFGISSERKLAKEIQVNLAYRYFLGYSLDEATPNHSVLSKARKRFDEEVFTNIFYQIVIMCKEKGLIGGDDAYVDSTIINANASLKSFVKDKEQVTTFLKEVREGESCTEKKTKSSRDIRNEDGDLNETRLGKRRQRNVVNRNHQSKTDKDASILYRMGTGRKSCYKGHVIADGKERVIVGVQARKGSDSDVSALPDLIKQMEATNTMSRYIVGDNHYGSVEAYIYLQDQKKMQTVIKPKKSKNRPGFLTESDFIYDPIQDHYVCPNNCILNFSRREGRAFRKLYRAKQSDCATCPFRSTCTTSKQGYRTVSRLDGPWVDRAQKLCQSPHGKRMYRRRQTCIEGVFGEGKVNHNLGRMQFRGLKNANIQLLMIAITMNLKRLIKYKPHTKKDAFSMLNALIMPIKTLVLTIKLSQRRIMTSLSPVHCN